MGAEEQATESESPAGMPSRGAVFINESANVQVGDNNVQNIYLVGRETWTARLPLQTTGGMPYRGLSAFEASDHKFFFGRDAAITEVMNRLPTSANGILVVSGVSGTGKSSLLRAGMLPRLRLDGLPGNPGAKSWPCLLFTPRTAPLDELVAQVADMAGIRADKEREPLAAAPGRFALLARQAVLAKARQLAEQAGQAAPDVHSGKLLLVIDQFEQLFTLCADEAEREAFITAVASAAKEPDAPALVVLGVRADFEARCAEYPQLTAAIQDRYLLTSMTERELEIAIAEPARQAGARVEPVLTDHLLREARGNAGVLPLLSYALAETWLAHTGDTLTLAGYDRTGGIEAAVATAAQRAYDTLTERQKDTARQVFLQLTATSDEGTDTAVPARRAELDAGRDPGDVQTVLDTFAGERLLTLTSEGAEISHEVVLTAWPLLRDTWLEETRADRVLRTRLRNAATDWDAHPRDRSYLWSGALLASALAAADRITAAPDRLLPLKPTERAFLSASQQSARRGKRRRQALRVVAALLVATAAAVIVFIHDSRVATAQQHALAASYQLAAESAAISGSNPVLARELAVASWRIDPSSSEAQYAMRTAAALPMLAFLSDSPYPAAAVAFSPDGKILATGQATPGVNGEVELWSTASHQLVGHLLTVPKAGAVTSLAFSHDGTLLAIATEKGGAQLWNVRTGRLVAGLPACGSDDAQVVAFSPDDATVAVAAKYASATCVQLLNVASQRPEGPPLLHAEPVAYVDTLAFRPDGKVLAVATVEGYTQLWNLASRQLTLMRTSSVPGLIAAYHGSAAAAYSPDGTTLAIGSTNDVQVLNTVTGRPIRSLSLTDATARALAYSPDGTTLAVSDNDGRTWLWDLSTGQASSPLAGGDGYSGGLAFSPDGGMLAVGAAGGTQLWSVPAATYGPAEDRPADLHTKGGYLQFSHDGKALAIDEGVVTRDSAIAIFSTATGAMTASIPAAPSTTIMAFSPDDTMLTVADVRGARPWDLAGRASPSGPAVSYATGLSGSDSVAISPDGTRLAANLNGHLTLWDLAERHPAAVSLGTTEFSTAMVFSPDGTTLAVGSFSETQVWNLVTSRQADILPTGDVISLAFTPDGKTLAVRTGSAVQLWDLGSGKPDGADFPVPTLGSDMAFSPDGSVLAVAAGTSTQLWDVATRQLIGSLPSPGNGIVYLEFSPDGTTLAASVVDGPTQLWNLGYLLPSRTPAYVCAQAGQTLTLQQWTQYAPGIPYQDTCPPAP